MCVLATFTVHRLQTRKEVHFSSICVAYLFYLRIKQLFAPNVSVIAFAWIQLILRCLPYEFFQSLSSSLSYRLFLNAVFIQSLSSSLSNKFFLKAVYCQFPHLFRQFCQLKLSSITAFFQFAFINVQIGHLVSDWIQLICRQGGWWLWSISWSEPEFLPESAPVSVAEERFGWFTWEAVPSAFTALDGLTKETAPSAFEAWEELPWWQVPS